MSGLIWIRCPRPPQFPQRSLNPIAVDSQRCRQQLRAGAVGYRRGAAAPSAGLGGVAELALGLAARRRGAGTLLLVGLATSGAGSDLVCLSLGCRPRRGGLGSITDRATQGVGRGELAQHDPVPRAAISARCRRSWARPRVVE